jgi:ketosteroid isomerase-like protein/mono/diheme cytochrome c family protein
MKHAILGAIAAFVVILATLAIAIGSGAYNVAADTPHTAPVAWLLATARERSIDAHAASIEVPDLVEEERIRRGAGNYDAMCKGCHLEPGMQATEISRGLNPAPPNLSEHAPHDARETFWVVKHGIKASGMPAWSASMADDDVWDLVAFLQALPDLSADRYVAAVAASGGHSHSGPESEHDDAEHHHEAAAQTSGLDPDVASTVERFHSALASGDAEAVMGLLEPDLIVLEGGNAERSRQEYAGHHLPADLEFMHAMSYELAHQAGGREANLAWVVNEGRLAGRPDGDPVELTSMETLVLRKSGNAWRIAHVHWSSRALDE